MTGPLLAVLVLSLAADVETGAPDEAPPAAPDESSPLHDESRAASSEVPGAQGAQTAAPRDDATNGALGGTHEAALRQSIGDTLDDGAGADGPFVLALGVNDGDAAGLAPLLFADDDAAEVVRLFGASQRTRLLTVMDRSTQQRYPDLANAAAVPTREALGRAVAELAAGIRQQQALGRRPVAVVWISGHADYDADGHPYLPLANGRLSADELLDEVVRPLASAHRVHLVIDTCFASALVKSKAVVQDASEAEAQQAFLDRRVGGLANVGLLAGSTATHRAYEWEEIRGGVFSAMVRAGLRGAADVDGDDAVSYPELHAFLAAAARDVAAEQARPRVRVVPPAVQADAALVRRQWLKEVAVFQADLSPLGTVHILDDTGAWLLAGAFEPGHRPRLWLPRGRRLFLRSDQLDHQLIEDASGFTLGPSSARASRPRSLVGTALREGLFKQRFGPAFFGGFSAFAERATRRAEEGVEEGSRLRRDDDEVGAGVTQVEQDDGVRWVAIATLSGAAAVGGVMAASGAFFILSVVRFTATNIERQAAWELNNALLAGAISAGALVACGALLGGGAVMLVAE